jgi:hypothetical protein
VDGNRFDAHLRMMPLSMDRRGLGRWLTGGACGGVLTRLHPTAALVSRPPIVSRSTPFAAWGSASAAPMTAAGSWTAAGTAACQARPAVRSISTAWPGLHSPWLSVLAGFPLSATTRTRATRDQLTWHRNSGHRCGICPLLPPNCESYVAPVRHFQHSHGESRAVWCWWTAALDQRGVRDKAWLMDESRIASRNCVVVRMCPSSRSVSMMSFLGHGQRIVA